MATGTTKAVSLLLTASLLLAACGDDDDSAGSDDETTTTEVAVTEPESEPQAPDTVSTDELSSTEFGYRPVEFRDQILDRPAEFERLDADGDGFLVVDEYNGTAKLFADMDTDGDAKLSPEETEYMMVFAEIPAGSFVMGSDEPIQAFFEPDTDVMPAHEVTIDAFKMGATEITNAQYVMYLNSALEAGEITVRLGEMNEDVERFHYPVATWLIEGGPGATYEGLQYLNLSPVTGLSHHVFEDNTLLIPEHPFNVSWIDYDPDTGEFEVRPGFEDWPVAYLKWWGAMAFAEYYDLSLPTEAEWEYVAAGGQQFEFASGDGEYGCQGANYACYNVNHEPNWTGTDTPEAYIGFRYTVGSYPANPYGVYDLSGNVWEGTLDWYDADFYQHLVDNGITHNPINLEGEEPPLDGSATGGPGQEFSHDARVYKGGSYNYHEAVARTAYRFPVYPWIGNDHFGGRVVLRPETVVFNGQG